MSSLTDAGGASSIKPNVAGENAKPPGGSGALTEKQRIMREQEAQFASKHGIKKPTVSALAQKRISRGGCQYFDSGEYNKNKNAADGKPSSPAASVTAPLAVKPGPVEGGDPGHLSVLPRPMQRKPSGASRLGFSPPSHSPPKDASGMASPN